MRYISAAETAKKWGLSGRAVRSYCSDGRIPGAFIDGGMWNIPDDALPPERDSGIRFTGGLLNTLKHEMEGNIKDGIYGKVQTSLTYNSNRIDGNRLTEEQVRTMFETNTVLMQGVVNADDIVETANHFSGIEHIILNADRTLSERMIMELHSVIRTGMRGNGTAQRDAGQYKTEPNDVGGEPACPPEDVAERMGMLLSEYDSKNIKTISDIVDLHQKFGMIHPFRNGNGRVGRLIMFKECLANDIVPFIINGEHRWFYFRGLKEWNKWRGYLMDTCLSSQDRFREWMADLAIDHPNDH